MNKTNLQKELLEKVKTGIKPSDLKKKKPNPLDLSTNPTKEPKSKENLTNNPPLSPYEDEGYESDNPSRNNRNNENLIPNKTIQQLEQERNFEAQKAQNYLEQITKLTAELDNANLEIQELKKIKPTKTQTELELALKEANQKIRDQEKTIQNLQSQAKNPANNKQEPLKENEHKHFLFTCNICEQHKKSSLHLARVNGLGIDPNKQNKICDYCINRVDIIKIKEEF